jgi:hypothetical protein
VDIFDPRGSALAAVANQLLVEAGDDGEVT